jgi:Flp pilus assembly pilin Flp
MERKYGTFAVEKSSILAIRSPPTLLTLSLAHPDRRGSGCTKENNPMLNLVEKYSVEAPEATEEGVVAIEYVIVAAALVVALAALWTAFGTSLSTKLQDVVDNITA